MSECSVLEKVLERIDRACLRSGRSSKEVRLLGATKTVPPEKIRKFYQCGLRLFGENRVQEFLKKYEDLRDLDIEWHFIGRLQSNKVKYILGKATLIHSLDRESLLEELEKRAGRLGIVQECLVEVNLGGEETKGGLAPQEVLPFVEKVLQCNHVKVTGLMTIPPYFEDPEKSRPYFEKLRNLRDSLESALGIRLSELSMGMSSDFEVAIEEGATIVRIGTALFGERD